MASLDASSDADRAFMQAVAAKMLAGHTNASSSTGTVMSARPRNLPLTPSSTTSMRSFTAASKENEPPAQQEVVDQYKGPSLFGTADQLKEARMFIHDATKGGGKSRVRTTRSQRPCFSRTASPITTRSLDRYMPHQQDGPPSISDISFRTPHLQGLGSSAVSTRSASPATLSHTSDNLLQAEVQPYGPSYALSRDRPSAPMQTSESSATTPMEGVEPATNNAPHIVASMQTSSTASAMRVSGAVATPPNAAEATKRPSSKSASARGQHSQGSSPQPKRARPSSELKVGSTEWMMAVQAEAKEPMKAQLGGPTVNGELEARDASSVTATKNSLVTNAHQHDKPSSDSKMGARNRLVKTESDVVNGDAHSSNDLASQLQTLAAKIAMIEVENSEMKANISRLLDAEVRRKYLGTDYGKESFDVVVHLPSHGIQVKTTTKKDDKISSLIRAAACKVSISLVGKDPRLSYKGDQVGHLMLVGEVGITAGDTVDVTL